MKYDTKDTVQAFCRAWFEQRDITKTVSFLTEDVSFFGTGMDEHAFGRAEMSAYVQEDIQEITEPFSCVLNVVHEYRTAGHICNISAKLTLISSLYTWHLHAFFDLVRQDSGDWLIQGLHFAEPGSSQRGKEHYPKTLVMEHIAKQRQELLNDSMAGGMMGGYIEDGFPYYFINRQLLDYLDYEDEADFINDIGGMVSNCIHPDDRKAVDEMVSVQLAGADEYIAEYRMRKKDGSYIWVHDLGRKITAEDGRPAIVSVCIDISDQRKIRDELLHLYNNIPGAIFRCRYDADFSVIDANDGLFDFLGYSREEFASMGSRLSAVIHPEDLAGMAERTGGQLNHGNTVHSENRVICKDGIVKWVSMKAQFFQEKEEAQLFCVFIDISDEKRRQERNRELYERELAYFVELSSEEGSSQGRANVTQNRTESYISIPQMAIARAGTTYDELVKHFAASAVDPSYGETIRDTLIREKVLEDYQTGRTDFHFEFLRRRNCGDAFWSNTSFRLYREPETRDIVAFFYTTDNTLHKIQEQLLQKIARLDHERLTDVDIRQDTYRILSFERDEDKISPHGEFMAEARLIADRFMDEDAKREYLEKLDFQYMEERLAREPVYSFVIEMLDEQGNKRVKRFQVFYIEKSLGRVCVARSDVTDVVQKEQRQKEELASALVAAEQANAAKSDFLSRMSHEIRTPMNAIIGMSTIAAQSVGDDEQVADCISKIGISSRFLLSLINDILDMSRIESGKMLLKNEKIPTEEFLTGINSICYSQAEAKGVDYECIVDPVLDSCYIGDAMKLQQVLLNILSNAIKFTGEGGKVTFSASQRHRTKNDAALRFIVNDTGVGMSEEFLPHIFEPFSQESIGTTALYGGTGLGLAISKSIADMMDGAITVRSIKDIGTEFTVDVKLGISEEEKLRRFPKKQDYNFSHLKTLVVDDDVVVCQSAVVTLREMGVVAEWVDSGRKAVDRVQELWDTGRYYDMILIDWKMPGMDGIETAKRIRAIVGPEVTIIIMTAYDWISIEHEAKLAGVNLLMSKPMYKSILVSAFSRALGEKEEQEREEKAEEYDFSGKRILLAEDNEINTEVAVMLLKNKGFTVDTAENGLRAMELFSKSPEKYYDAVLMDIRMPFMDGLTAAASIRHLSNADAGTIPIIAMTANAFDDDIQKSKAAGMDAHLAKPIDSERLYQTLYHFISRKES
ncbi:response regulator [Lacrimispora sp. NSJ-141]|uniref:Circadian input-output histidine kinase CikA n=1 Tax=Lientehia hominis TaxID=2897778 RepID=A0AAP2W8D9_9FIRM|nr:response regulator [Lientehia hominis]MCD2493393.1 response regulator [Lientehia hominis]